MAFFIACMLICICIIHHLSCLELNLDKVKAFEASFSKNGINAANVKHSMISNKYRGLVACKSFSKGESVLSVPIKSCLVSNSKSINSFPSSLQAIWKQLDTGYDRLALQLFVESLKVKDETYLSDYIRFLPVTYSCLYNLHIKNIHKCIRTYKNTKT